MLLEKKSKKMNKEIVQQLKKLNKKIDILLIIELVRQGLKLKEIAAILGISERAVRNIISVRKIKRGKQK